MIKQVTAADYGALGSNGDGLYEVIQSVIGGKGYGISLLEEIKRKQGVYQAGNDANKWAQAMNSAILIWNQSNPKNDKEIRHAFGL